MFLLFLIVLTVAAMIVSWRYAGDVANVLQALGIDRYAKQLFPWVDLHIHPAQFGFGEVLHRYLICYTAIVLLGVAVNLIVWTFEWLFAAPWLGAMSYALRSLRT